MDFRVKMSSTAAILARWEEADAPLAELTRGQREAIAELQEKAKKRPWPKEVGLKSRISWSDSYLLDAGLN